MTLGSLAIPAAALADGQLDPAFNGTGYKVGTAAEGTNFSNGESRNPMVAQIVGGETRIVMGGTRAGFMTLVRYRANGTVDTTFGGNGTGFQSMQFAGTGAGSPGGSGAVAMKLDSLGRIVVAGFGGSASIVVARFTADGVYNASSVCFAPLHIDYAARAIALRTDTTAIVVGYARDRHPSVAVPGTPNVLYGARAVVTLPATGNSTTMCGGDPVTGQGAPGVTIDGLNHDGTGADPALAGRYYEGVSARANDYTVVSNIGPDGTSWVQRFAGAGLGATDPAFNGGARLAMAGVNLHAIAQAADGTAYVAGEAIGAGAADRPMVVTRLTAAGAPFAGFGTAGTARIRVGGGNNLGQAVLLQGTNVIVGGSANLAARASLGVARLRQADGQPDPAFDLDGQVTTPIGTPSINAYITSMALSGNFVAVAGRAVDASGVTTVAARYFHTGAPVPPPPAPAASTQSVDSITTSSARINGEVNANGTASTWWVEYGTTTAYGSVTPAQPLAASNDDVDVQASLTALAAGTAYHARIVISSTAGTVPGDDVAFTTLGIATPTTGTTGGTTTTTTTTGGSKTTTTVKKAKKRSCIVPKVVGKKLNKARTTVYAKGCKVQVKYVKSLKVKNTVLAQSRKAGKKLGFRAVVRLTVAAKVSAKS